MDFLSWVEEAESDIFKIILTVRKKSEFSQEELCGLREENIDNFIDDVNRHVVKTRNEYKKFLEENPESEDNQDTFEFWYDYRNGLRVVEDIEDNEKNKEKQSKEKRKDKETYEEFLRRTGFEDTEQNHQKFIIGYSDDEF